MLVYTVFTVSCSSSMTACWQGRVYAPGDSGDKMALAIKEFNEYVIKDKRVEVIALPFRDGVNIVQRRYEAFLCRLLQSSQMSNC